MTTIEKVEYYLQKYPETRDNDNILLAKIWWDEVPTGSNIYHFFERLIDSELTNFESIRRCRQKLQEENPELRGAKYKKRTETSAPKVSDAIVKGTFQGIEETLF